MRPAARRLVVRHHRWYRAVVTHRPSCLPSLPYDPACHEPQFTNPQHQRRRYLQTTVQTQSAGLFSIPELQVPEDFAVLTKKAIDECNQLRSAVSATVANTTTLASKRAAVQLLHQLDDISKTVCNVIDAAELCRSVHADDHWRQAANRSFTVLSDYIALLNSDTTLYQALQLVARCHFELSEEQRRFAVLLEAEFERDGIHLSDEKRETVRVLQNHITSLESSFSYNLVHSRKLFDVEHGEAVTNVIPRPILQQWGVFSKPTTTTTTTLAADSSTTTTTLQLGNTDAPILQTLLKYSDDPHLRQQVFLEHLTSVPENLIVLDELVQTRHSLAVIQGFASYVERNLHLDKMAGSAKAVKQFLTTAVQSNRTAYQRDMQALCTAKNQIQRDSSALEPWDIAFYTGLLKAREGDLRSSVSAYLTVHNTLTAMQVLVEQLFGIEMKEASMTAVEQWDVVAAAGGTNHESSQLRKFSFTHSGGPLGTMFLDLHPREAKFGHAAHFTVRCGCALNSGSDDEDDTSDDYQYPIVALVCNLSSTITLSHSEVETLFHEFGHALHSLLSRTRFQHMSGTRAAMDFVETPSHLMENFVWDPEFLKILALHHQTGDAMPDEMITQLQQSRYEFAAIDRQNQILYSLFDQQLFGVPDPSGPTSTEIFARLHRELGVPYADGTHWHSRFGHLVSYGAGYYGYLYSQVFARDIWKRCFEGNSLDRQAGQQLWHQLLGHGGAKDPRAMLTDLLGRPPQIDFSS